MHHKVFIFSSCNFCCLKQGCRVTKCCASEKAVRDPHFFQDSHHSHCYVFNQVACYAMIEECFDFSCLNIHVTLLVSMILLCFVSSKMLFSQSPSFSPRPEKLKWFLQKSLFLLASPDYTACTIPTVGLLRPRSLGSLSTSCKYHLKDVSVCPPEEARKPIAISSDDRTSQTSDKEERKSEIIWPSMTREMGSCI